MGVELGAGNASALVRAGTALLAAARAQYPVNHPYDPALSAISLVMLHGPATHRGVSGLVLSTPAWSFPKRRGARRRRLQPR